jgi:nitrogen PTS system EIIA component
MISIDIIMKNTFVYHSSVRLADLFPPEAIHVGLEPHTKFDVIAELVHQAVVVGHLPQRAEKPIRDAILERESLGSTALGHGIAFPHCRWRSLDWVVGIVGVFHPGIPFDAADGEPVDTVFLTLVPPEEPEPFHEVIDKLVAIGRDQSRHEQLSGCQTAEEVSKFLAELDPPVVDRHDELARMSLSWRNVEKRDPRRELAIFSLTREDRPDGDVPEPRWL